MVTALDHISGGRAYLGIGSAWDESEAQGLRDRDRRVAGERLRWLREALPVMRGMLHGERAVGRRAALCDGRRAQRPAAAAGAPADHRRRRRRERHAAPRRALRGRVQHRLRQWARDLQAQGRGAAPALRRKSAATSARSSGPSTSARSLIRDSHEEALRVLEGIYEHNGKAETWAGRPASAQPTGSPEQIVGDARAVRRAGLPARRVRLPGAIRRGDDGAPDAARCSQAARRGRWLSSRSGRAGRSASRLRRISRAAFAPGIGGGAVSARRPSRWRSRSRAPIHPPQSISTSGRTASSSVGRTRPRRWSTPVRRQAARSLSLDHDGTDWPAVGERDPVIGRLQEAHGYPPPGVLLLGVRGGDLVRDRPAHLDAPERAHQEVAGRGVRRSTDRRRSRVRRVPAPGAPARGHDRSGPEREEGWLAARHRPRGDGRSAGH